MAETVWMHQIRPYVNSPHADSKGADCPKGRGVLRKKVKDERDRPGLQKRPDMHLAGFRGGELCRRARIVAQGSKR